MTTTSGAVSRTARTASPPVAASPDDLHALLLEQVPQAGAEQVVVVDDQHAKRVDRAHIDCRQRLGHPPYEPNVSGA